MKRAIRAWLFPLALFSLQPTWGAVVYTDIPDVLLNGFAPSPTTFDIDLDGNGTVDVAAEARLGQLTLIASESSRIGGVPATPPNVNSFSAPFEEGAFIGQTLEFDEWNSGRSTAIACFDFGCFGLWGENTGYVAVEFEIDSLTHYGWVLLDVPFISEVGWVRSFAYESQPGVAIVAGAIPEPSVGILIGASTVLLMSRRRRRR